MENVLKILIEADAAGLQSQLKRATQSIQQFIGQMNGQEVNWEKILSGTISPAIISGIAGTFALALGEALTFQSSMTTNMGALFDSFDGNLKEMTKAIQSVANLSGSSSTDTANALGITSHALTDQSTAALLAGESLDYARVSGMSYQEVLSHMVPIWQSWNISAAQTPAAMAALTQEFEKSGMTAEDFFGTIFRAGPAMLKAGENITDFATGLATVAKSSDPTQAKSLFDVIINGAKDGTSWVNGLFGSFNGLQNKLKEGGIGAVIQTMLDKTKSFGAAAVAAMEKLGVPADVTLTLQNYSSSLDGIAGKIDAAKTKIIPFKDEISKMETPMSLLTAHWNNFKTDLGAALSGSLGTFLVTLSNILDKIDSVIKLFSPGASADDKSKGKSNIGSVATMASLGLAGAIQGGEIGAGLGSFAGPLGTLLGGALGSVVGGTAGILAGNKLSNLAIESGTNQGLGISPHSSQNAMKDTTPTPAGSANSNSVNSTIYNITANALEKKKGAGSLSLEAEAYNKSFH